MTSPRDEKRSGSNVNPTAAGKAQRRQVPVHRLRNANGVLGWTENGQEYNCRMTVVEISAQAAAVFSESAPPAGGPAWIFLPSGLAGAERLEARVVSTAADVSGKSVVLLELTAPIALESVLDEYEEHRFWQRFPARETRAILTWLDQDVGHTAPGELLNISGGGAAVATQALLPEQGSVWLTLDAEPSPVTPVRCRVVAIAVAASGIRIARLRFDESCPVDLFELAVHGAPA
jgi:hypothetical protein